MVSGDGLTIVCQPPLAQGGGQKQVPVHHDISRSGVWRVVGASKPQANSAEAMVKSSKLPRCTSSSVAGAGEGSFPCCLPLHLSGL